LRRSYEGHDHFYVLNDRIDLPDDMKGRTVFIVHAERDLKVVVNFVEAFFILLRNRPDVVLSTGAGPAVPFAIVGRYLFGTKLIYLETITSVTRASLTGRIMARIAHRFFYQWEALRPLFPRGEHVGPLV
jgi:UDP-N-acetylglucosamine:LPS N-acetylglucosamine transferase